uniref:RAB19, member RAS oncogene family n=1 Tax=Bubo bubo TaxID=30461 RepID=A0A8C0IGA1_BUBBB
MSLQAYKCLFRSREGKATLGICWSLQLVSFLLQIQVWDTAGQERFRTITQSYYRSAHGAILAYDLTRRSTFESIPHWIHEIEKYGAANLVMMLIGRNLIFSNM